MLKAMAIVTPSANLTPKEHQQMEFEKEMFDKQAEYNLEIKRLELEVVKIEARFSSWLKLTATLIKLPVYILLAIGYIISTVTKKEPPDKFWEFINK